MTARFNPQTDSGVSRRFVAKNLSQGITTFDRGVGQKRIKGDI